MCAHHDQSRPTPSHHDEIMQFHREMFAEKKRPAAPEPPRPARPMNPANPDEISTEEYFRQLFAGEGVGRAGSTLPPKTAASTGSRPAPSWATAPFTISTIW